MLARFIQFLTEFFQSYNENPNTVNTIAYWLSYFYSFIII